YMSFFKWDPISGRKKFLGLANFRYLFQSEDFRKVFSNTIIYMLAILFVYAILWQQFLKRFDLTTCYASRAMSSVYTMLIAYLIFHETITLPMIIGSLVIIAGVFLVVSEVK
ncbi:MAG: sugar ABC transporter permease, partial [Solobacterium sp.]|nr:sugar ABC transporter permease [Solobacterium sp.]